MSIATGKRTSMWGCLMPDPDRLRDRNSDRNSDRPYYYTWPPEADTPTRITLMGTVPNRPRCAWCTHPLDVHGAYGCDTDDCRCGRAGA